MRYTILYSIIALMLFLVTSCENVLEQKPVDSFNEESVYMDIDLAKAALGKCYQFIGGDNNYVLGLRQWTLSAASDESLCTHGPQQYTFVKGTMSPDYLGAWDTWRFSYIQWDPLYKNIKNTNVFLANIDNVPVETSSDEDLKTRLKGEAYFIRAFNYTNLMRSYGGLVLVDKPFELDEDFLSIDRSGIDETLDFIISDLDKAIELLPEKGNIEQGRATKGAAAALKSRVLSWSTGILMNGGYEPSNSLVSFQEGTREERLRAAKQIAKDIMDGKFGHYALTGTTEDPPANITEEIVKEYSDNFFNIFTQKGEWNDEIIWGIQYLREEGTTVSQNKWYGPNGYHGWGNNTPTEIAVRKFEMKDGTPFQWDKYNPGNLYTREFTTAELEEDPERNPYIGREPRFYASILFDGAKWQKRPTDTEGNDPEGRVQTGYYIDENGGQRAGLDTRQADIEGWNGTKTGYYLKKFMDPTIEGQYFNNENTWIELRYAEVILDYAEACFELGDMQEGLNALNMIRNRAGLPDRETTDKEQAIEWLRYERFAEFFGGGDRWYMIRKWMIADEILENVHAMIIYHYPDRTKWHYDTSTTVDDRIWNDRQYWVPISRTEINKAPQLTQNPGY